MKDEDCEAHTQEQLASLKRDMRKTMEDATVRAVHKVVAEFEAKSDERLMENAQGDLERIKLVQTGVGIGQRAEEAYKAAKERGWVGVSDEIAQPEQEPVAAECKFDREQKWMRCEIAHHNLVQFEPEKWPGYQTRLLYTSPPAQRTWVGLTDEERKNLWREVVGWGDPSHDDEDLMKAIEAKLKEKNT